MSEESDDESDPLAVVVHQPKWRSKHNMYPLCLNYCVLCTNCVPHFVCYHVFLVALAGLIDFLSTLDEQYNKVKKRWNSNGKKKENLEPHLRVDHLSKLLIVQGVPRLVHRTCTNWAPPWAHAFISKQFLSMVTLSVTAWTLLVHICKQVSFQVGHSNLHYCEP